MAEEEQIVCSGTRERNLEGIISKRIDTPYRSGPFSGWRKIKNHAYVRP